MHLRNESVWTLILDVFPKCCNFPPRSSWYELIPVVKPGDGPHLWPFAHLDHTGLGPLVSNSSSRFVVHIEEWKCQYLWNLGPRAPLYTCLYHSIPLYYIYVYITYVSQHSPRVCCRKLWLQAARVSRSLWSWAALRTREEWGTCFHMGHSPIPPDVFYCVCDTVCE